MTETKENIRWRDSLVAAKTEAAQSGKLIFLELFSPKCAGCQNVEARTLPDPRVESLLNEAMVPLHFNVLDEPQHMKQYVAAWTPTMIVMDAQGRELRRSTGFLDADHFLSEMALAQVYAAFDGENYADALQYAETALQLSHGDELRHSEALFWRAIAQYKTSHEQQDLVAGWEDLLARYPDSEWGRKVDFVSAM